MIDKVLTVFLGSKAERDIKNLIPPVQKISSLEPRMMGLADEDFPLQTAQLRGRHRGGESLEALLPEAFALVREAARRTLGERLFDVQLMGGIVLHQGKIMEMKTGEGKTLSSVPAAYLNSLTGEGVHVVTVNDYLAERDAAWMGPIYRFLGVSVGAILSQMDNAARRAAYRQDITYGTNNEFGFDYLRDNMCWDSPRQGAARPQLLHRRRDRLHPHRRGAHPAHHLRDGRGRHLQDLRGQQAGRLPGRVREGPRDRTTTRSSPRGTTRSRRRTSGSPSPTRG